MVREAAGDGVADVVEAGLSIVINTVLFHVHYCRRAGDTIGRRRSAANAVASC